MFRSKAFTAAFSILSVLIVGLIVIFCYLVFGNGKDKIAQIYEGGETVTYDEAALTAAPEEIPTNAETGTETESAEKESTEESTDDTESETSSSEESTAPEEDSETAAAELNVVRALRADEPHSYPVIGQDIPEAGVATIIKSGDNGEGIVFHAAPAFDAADTPGNLTNYSGGYDILNKIYILNNGSPFLMYKTFDNYYVTSSPAYISFQPSSLVQPADPVRIGDYGLSEGEEIAVRVFHEDGNHVVFTIYNYSPASGELLPVLENVIAQYNGSGFADFEYLNTDGQTHNGKIGFEKVQEAEYSRRVDVVFESPVAFRSGERSEVVLHN